MITRRRFVRFAGAGLGLGAGMGLFGWHVGGRLPTVHELSLTLPGLPPGFDGFTILLVTDVHAGAHMDADRLQALAEFLGGLHSDLLVLGGDMVDGSADVGEMRAWTEAFTGLSGRAGAVGVTGNHEFMAGIDASMHAIAKAGFDLIRNDHRLFERNGDALSLLGVDDPNLTQFDPPQDEAVADVFAGSPRDAFPILLAHRPAAFAAAATLGIPLTLSGHTHGGQVGLPWRDLVPVRMATPYVRGLYELGDARLVVSEGVGTGGFPFRIGVPPAVSRIALRRGGAS